MPARIVGFRLDPHEASWLEAVGLSCGGQVTVLRKALFGGPLHIRTGEGGEFAVDRTLASHVDVTPLSGLEAP
jgi:ferrous iron transport protein A